MSPAGCPQCSWSGGRTNDPCSPFPVPTELWTFLFMMMTRVLKAITQAELQKSEQDYLSGKIDIITCNRLSNCVCNRFLLKTLVHLRRETSCFLCKEECHHDLSLINHPLPVPNLHFPVFSVPVASFSLEKQSNSSSDFLGALRDNFVKGQEVLFQLQPKAFPFFLSPAGGFPNFAMALKSTCRHLFDCFCWSVVLPFSQRPSRLAAGPGLPLTVPFPTFFFYMSKETKVIAPSAETSIYLYVPGNARLQNVGFFFQSLYITVTKIF